MPNAICFNHNACFIGICVCIRDYESGSFSAWAATEFPQTDYGLHNIEITAHNILMKQTRAVKNIKASEKRTRLHVRM